MCSPRTVGLAIGPPSSARFPEPVGGYRYSVVTAAMPGLPHAPTNKHEQRLALQDAGSATYLIAWQGGLPVGHVLVRHPPVSEQGATARCAELEDLFVCETTRRRGIGRALLAAAEGELRREPAGSEAG
jgi:GNAT superfamily N-acetyltransferase